MRNVDYPNEELMSDFYYKQILAVTKKGLEKKFHTKIIAISLSGSTSVGLNNSLSDIDVVFLYIGKPLVNDQIYGNRRIFHDTISITVGFTEIAVDAVGIHLDSVIYEVSEYKKYKDRRYPTILNRNESQVLAEEFASRQISSNFYREDYARFFIYQILFADHRIIESYTELINVFRPILFVKDIADPFFSRAYGNFLYSIKVKNTIQLRKYGYTLHEILYCKWLFCRHEIPPMGIQGLLEIVDEKHRGNIEFIIRSNASANKDKNCCTIEANYELNVFIADEIANLVLLFEDDSYDRSPSIICGHI